MKIKNFLVIILILIFSISCSSSYKKLSNNTFSTSDEFSSFLLNEYKNRADYEAKEMHDWNSAKLYSEKALLAINGVKIKPEKIDYWKISNEHVAELHKAFDNLMSIYLNAIETNPLDLAVAISALDCWGEQQEENWQTWDIEKCKNDYLNAMHNIYNTISKKEIHELNTINAKTTNESVSIVTKNENEEILQIIYFDFDKSNLTHISLKEIKIFLEKYDDKIEKYLIIGHTDTKGTKEYNFKLSLKRALTIKNVLINSGISETNIKIIGKGETALLIKTPDETAHPANRRAEISPIN